MDAILRFCRRELARVRLAFLRARPRESRGQNIFMMRNAEIPEDENKLHKIRCERLRSSVVQWTPVARRFSTASRR